MELGRLRFGKLQQQVKEYARQAAAVALESERNIDSLVHVHPGQAVAVAIKEVRKAGSCGSP